MAAFLGMQSVVETDADELFGPCDRQRRRYSAQFQARRRGRVFGDGLGPSHGLWSAGNQIHERAGLAWIGCRQVDHLTIVHGTNGCTVAGFEHHQLHVAVSRSVIGTLTAGTEAMFVQPAVDRTIHFAGRLDHREMAETGHGDDIGMRRAVLDERFVGPGLACFERAPSATFASRVVDWITRMGMGVARSASRATLPSHLIRLS